MRDQDLLNTIGTIECCALTGRKHGTRKTKTKHGPSLKEEGPAFETVFLQAFPLNFSKVFVTSIKEHVGTAENETNFKESMLFLFLEEEETNRQTSFLPARSVMRVREVSSSTSG